MFPPIERALRFKDERIRVGRYSDRDSSNPSAPVGFKSKVVSRRHCEFWCDGGQWYVKDVKSSSGTFLNHIRLSAPGMESKAYPLYDGDILQLGIDFKGGEEQIFRCVKIRVELNRAWQKSLNNFKYVDHLFVLEDWDRWERSASFFTRMIGLIWGTVCPRTVDYGTWPKATPAEQKQKTVTPAQLTPRNVQSVLCRLL